MLLRTKNFLLYILCLAVAFAFLPSCGRQEEVESTYSMPDLTMSGEIVPQVISEEISSAESMVSKEYEKGKITSLGWISEFFNISFNPPVEYLMMTDPELQELQELVGKEIIDYKKQDIICEMLAIESSMTGPILMVYTAVVPETETEEQYLKTMIKNGQKYAQSKQVTQVTIAGEKHFCAAFYVPDKNNSHKYTMKAYTRKKGSRMSMIMTIYNSKDGEAETLQLLSKFKKLS